MYKIIVTDREGAEHSIAATPGLSVMESIPNAGIDELLALCGGCCSCATCHVYLDERLLGTVGLPCEDEADLLDSCDHEKPTSRLSCQVVFSADLDGLRVTIAPED